MGGNGSSCGACKFLRRKCKKGCLFAPYFCYEQAAAHFAAVHKVFGASNVSKLLSNVPVNNRREAAATVAFEALARMYNPTYGCVAQIFALQQQVAILQEEIELLQIQVPNRTTHTVVNHQTSRAMNADGIGFQYSTSQQLNDMNLHNYCNQQQVLHDHSNLMNLNGHSTTDLTKDTNLEVIPEEQQPLGNHLFCEDYADCMQSSSTQLINPSLLDELLGVINQ